MVELQFSKENLKPKTPTEMFPCPPLITSVAADWENIYLEYHQQMQMDTSEIYSCNHVIFINLSRQKRMGEIWLNDHFQTATFALPGVLTVKPSGTAHRFVSKNPSEFIVVELKPELLVNLARDLKGTERLELIPHFYPQGDPLLLQLGLTLKAELESGCLGRKIYGDAIAMTMAVHLLRQYSTFDIPLIQNNNGLGHSNLNKIIDYIQTYLDRNLGIEQLASLCNLSPFHFSRLFKAATGLAPYQYISQQRIERGKHLLQNTNSTIAEIALDCGFSIPSSFSTAFGKAVGVTPSMYRKSFN